MSLDAVNQHLAARTAEQNGASLALLDRRAELAAWPGDAVVYDIDHLPANERERILDELTRGPVEKVTVVHSYNLRPSQSRALRESGVIVQRRLQPDWLGRLVRGAVKSPYGLVA